MATCCGLRSLLAAAAFMDDRRAAHNALVLCMAVQQQDPIGFLTSLPPAQHAPHAATPWQPGGAPRGHVGLEVTKRAPFQVVAIDRLMDLEDSQRARRAMRGGLVVGARIVCDAMR
jgi:hypothetical protein